MEIQYVYMCWSFFIRLSDTSVITRAFIYKYCQPCQIQAQYEIHSLSESYTRFWFVLWLDIENMSVLPENRPRLFVFSGCWQNRLKVHTATYCLTPAYTPFTCFHMLQFSTVLYKTLFCIFFAFMASLSIYQNSFYQLKDLMNCIKRHQKKKCFQVVVKNK